MQNAETTYGFELKPWWNNLNEKVAYERMFAEGQPQKQRIAQAMISANPLTPRAEIKQNMIVKGTPPRFGYRTDELTITDVIDHDYADHENAKYEQNHRLWNDFSGSDGEINSTDRPYLSVW